MTRARKLKLQTFAVALGLTLGAAAPAAAQYQDEGWDGIVAPYLLFGSLSGESAIGPLPTTTIDLGFGDLVKRLEMGAMAHVEIWGRGSWGLVTDFVYLALGSDVSLGQTAVLDIDVDEVIVEALGAYRFATTGGWADLFAGVRYWDIGVDVQFDAQQVPIGTRQYGDSWIDPVVGGRINQSLAPKWSFTARGDAGGFGVGSDFSWNLQAGVAFDVSDRFSLIAQYKALGVDYANAEDGADFLLYDTTTHGPLVGFAFRY